MKKEEKNLMVVFFLVPKQKLEISSSFFLVMLCKPSIFQCKRTSTFNINVANPIYVPFNWGDAKTEEELLKIVDFQTFEKKL